MFSYFLEEEAFISSSKEGYFISDEDAALVQNHFSTSNNFVAKTYFNKSAEEIFVSNNQKQEITQEKEYKLEDFVATYVELLFKRDQKIKSIEKKIKKQMAKSVIN
jgi:DNA-binding transcriptional regulator YhcF (GntR family)